MRGCVAGALAAVAVVAGCGGDDDPADQRPAAQPVGEASGGSVAQFADCGDWRKGTEAERYATIEELRGQLTAQTSESSESPLVDDRAYEILSNACRPSYAESLRLYKLYVRAQGFAPLSGEQP